MRRRLRLAWVAPLAFAAVGAALDRARAGDEPRDGTIALFNGKDLAGWTIYLDPDSRKYKTDPRPEDVFKVEDGAIHVSGERFGGITTRDEYADYRLVVEFRWGEKRWPPRETDKRDSGILLHCTGPAKIWTKSIECQIQEGDCGDFWLVDGTSIVVGDEKVTRYKQKARDAERPRGEWNTVEVICDGDTVTNIVNGQVVNKGDHASVTRGRILLQSEGAEIFFRKVELTPLSSRRNTSGR